MRLRDRMVRIGLLVFLVGGGLAAYRAGFYLWAAYHYRAAEGALARRDFTQADIHLAKVLSVAPGDARVRLLAAQTARRQGRFDEALEQLENCDQREELAEAVALEKKLHRLQAGDFSAADDLLAICGACADSPQGYLILEALIESGEKALALAGATRVPGELDEVSPHLPRTQAAVDLWLQAWPATTDQAQGLVWRAMIHAYKSETVQAQEDYRQALKLAPDHFEARRELALSIAYDLPQEALGHLELLRKRRPDDRRVSFALAVVQRRLGHLGEAAELLDDLLKADPNDVGILVERGYVAMNAGQPQDAERVLRKALELAPMAPFVNLAMSGCLNLAGKPAEAKRYFDIGKWYEDRQGHMKEAMRRQPESVADGIK